MDNALTLQFIHLKFLTCEAVLTVLVKMELLIIVQAPGSPNQHSRLLELFGLIWRFIKNINDTYLAFLVLFTSSFPYRSWKLLAQKDDVLSLKDTENSLIIMEYTFNRQPKYFYHLLTSKTCRIGNECSILVRSTLRTLSTSRYQLHYSQTKRYIFI